MPQPISLPLVAIALAIGAAGSWIILWIRGTTGARVGMMWRRGSRWPRGRLVHDAVWVIVVAKIRLAERAKLAPSDLRITVHVHLVKVCCLRVMVWVVVTGLGVMVFVLLRV